MGAAEDIERMKLLWQLGFGDEREWIDAFFRDYSRPANRFVLRAPGGEIVAMLHALPYERGVYIYGVTTHPQWRKRGLGRELMMQAMRQLERRGVPRATLIAEHEELRSWYAAMGFRLMDCTVKVTGYTGEDLAMPQSELNRPMCITLNSAAALKLPSEPLAELHVTAS